MDITSDAVKHTPVVASGTVSAPATHLSVMNNFYVKEHSSGRTTVAAATTAVPSTTQK